MGRCPLARITGAALASCRSDLTSGSAPPTSRPTDARRPKTPKLAGDPVLAAAVGGLLADRMSPHAISAQLRSEGHGICAETVYAACYDHSGARGLPEGSWKLLPRRCRKRRPRGRHARKPSPLGDFKAISQRPASVEDRRQPGHWEGDLIIGKANRSAVARSWSAPAARPSPSRCPTATTPTTPPPRSGAGPPAAASGQDADLGPGPRDGPLARHRGHPGHRGLLL